MIANLGYHSLLKRYGGLVGLVSHFYPHLPVEENYHHNSRKIQQLLFKSIKDLFPQMDVHNDYPHPRLLYEGMELFVYFM